jgi:hypothetical protein
MNYTEIMASNSQTGQRLMERFMDNGERFIKHIPFNPIIFVKLKEQFNGKNVNVELLSNHWINITKTGDNPELKNAAVQATGKTEITREEIISAEVDLLKKGGFIVQVKEVESE